MTQNQIAYHNMKENRRANVAKEVELNRHNLATEEAARVSNSNTSTRNANDFYIQTGQLAETKRNNLANEAEKIRSNTVNEMLTYYGKQIEKQNADTKWYEAESGRINAQANMSNAITNAGQLTEQNRTNLANEAIKQQQLEETHRANVEGENIKRFQAATGYQTTTDSNTISQQNADTNTFNANETKRNNLVRNYTDILNLMHDIDIDTVNAQTNAQANMSKPFRFGGSLGGIK